MLPSIYLITIAIVIIITAIYKYIDYYTYWQRQGIKARSYPNFGWIKASLNEFVTGETRKYGRIYGVYGIGQRALILNDPQIVRDLSIKELHKFPLRFGGYLGKTSIIHSLFMMPANEDWKRLRTILSPAFTSGKLKAMITPINQILENFIDHLDKHAIDHELFDIKIYTSALTMDVIAKCAYGIEVNSFNESDHPLVKHAQNILSLDVTFKQAFCFIMPYLAKLLNLDPFDSRSAKYFDDLTFTIIEERLKNRNIQSKDFIGLMVEQTASATSNGDSSSNHNENERKLKGITREEIAGQGIIFFLAGYDTTNVTLCHVIYYLIKYPEWQMKLYDELIEQDQPLDYEALRSLPILNAVICETLRLQPPLVSIQRTAIKEQTLLDTGIVIPAGATVIFHPHIIHRIPEYFPDPEAFKPQRFIGSNSMESSIAYMPFGVGHRLCIGMRFALNELRAAVAQLVLNYHLLPDPSIKLEYFKGNVIHSPKNVWIKIAKRYKFHCINNNNSKNE